MKAVKAKPLTVLRPAHDARSTMFAGDDELVSSMLRSLVNRNYTDRAQLASRLRREVIDPISVACLGLDRSLEGLSQPDSAGSHQAVAMQLTELRRVFRSLTAFEGTLYPRAFAELGLEASLHKQARLFSEMHPALDVQCKVDPEAATGKSDFEFAVYYMVHEALENIERHAKASKVEINLLAMPPSGFELIVTDDGSGMPEECLRYGALGIGLMSVRAMVTHSGGEFFVDAGMSGGTILKAVWPPALARR